MWARNGCRSGLTAIEVLVVIVSSVFLIIGLLIPAIMQSREAARRAQCIGHLSQLSLALHNYNSVTDHFPMTLTIQGQGNTVAWTNGFGGFTRILPYLENSELYNSMNFVLHAKALENSTATSKSVLNLTCPSDVNYAFVELGGSGPRDNSYGFIEGDWFVWGGLAKPGKNRSVFGPNQATTIKEIADGMSTTLMMSESKLLGTYYSDCSRWSLNDPDKIPDSDAIVPEYLSGCTPYVRKGRTLWFEAGVQNDGITTAWTPNKKTPGGLGKNHDDVDIVSRREELGGPTFAAVTARSFHSGGVNALFGDGSVRFLKDSIGGKIWRAIGTVDGGESLGSEGY